MVNKKAEYKKPRRRELTPQEKKVGKREEFYAKMLVEYAKKYGRKKRRFGTGLKQGQSPKGTSVTKNQRRKMKLKTITKKRRGQ
tara:strand:- start:57 stop:308 length:252 start_codon:yes stop_codon:yes gene_type:complete